MDLAGSASLVQGQSPGPGGSEKEGSRYPLGLAAGGCSSHVLPAACQQEAWALRWPSRC